MLRNILGYTDVIGEDDDEYLWVRCLRQLHPREKKKNYRLLFTNLGRASSWWRLKILFRRVVGILDSTAIKVLWKLQCYLSTFFAICWHAVCTLVVLLENCDLYYGYNEKRKFFETVFSYKVDDNAIFINIHNFWVVLRDLNYLFSAIDML